MIIGFGVLWLGLLIRYRSWLATNDHAILQLTLEEMRDGRIPLVGPYSRLDFRHPGPIREWLFFLPDGGSGGRSAALPASTVIFHIAMFGLSIRAGWKWAATRGAITASAGVLVMYAAIGKELAVPWNPFLAATAMFAAVWGLLSYLRTGAWLQAVVCASIAGQMHAPALPLAAAIVGIVAIVAIAPRFLPPSPSTRTARPETKPPALRAGAFIVVLLLWSGPLIDAIGADSNLSAALDASRVGESAGIPNALAFAGRIVNPVELAAGTFLRSSPGGLSGTGGVLPLLVWLIVGAGAVGIVVKRRDREGQVDLAVVATLCVASIVTMSRFVPAYFGHLFGSITAVAVVAITATVSVGAAALLHDSDLIQLDTAKPRFAASIGAGIMLIGTVAGVRFLNSNVVERQSLGAVGAVAAEVVPSRTYAVDAGGTVGAIVEAEVALTIERAGGEATSNLFALALPADTGDTPIFIVGMTTTRQCLVDLGVGRIVLDTIIESSQQPISIFLVDSAERAATEACLAR